MDWQKTSCKLQWRLVYKYDNQHEPSARWRVLILRLHQHCSRAGQDVALDVALLHRATRNNAHGLTSPNGARDPNGQ